MIATDSSSGARLPEQAIEPGHRLAELEMLFDISVRLAGTLDLLTVLELALENAEAVCHAETSSIWELDDERRELFFRVVRGSAAGRIRSLRIPVGEGIVGHVALTGQAEVVNDVAADPRWHGDSSGEFRTRALLAVPLLAQGRVIGVLQLLNPVGQDCFSGDDLRRMRLFASILAPSLQNARLYAAQQRQFLKTATAFAESIEKKDTYTGGHVRRVVAYSVLLGAQMGLGREDLKNLWLASTLHDIGKIGVPDVVLGKAGPLDAAEAEVMKSHTVLGAQIVSPLDNPSVLQGVRSHHERIDGKGYPDGLAGSEIPLVPRIIAVADTYDAMTSSRPYRAGLPPDRAVAEILAGAGTQFCPQVVAAFRDLVAEGRFSVEAAEGIFAELSEVG
jgi:HD-GYP domain-containing protein (c-di-GMP phosphodiesterase class II)